MTAATGWAPPNPRHKYGLGSLGADVTPLPRAAGPSTDAATMSTLYHPDGPMLWFGAFAAVTFGLMAFSGHGSIRLWKFRASADAGVGDPEKK